MSNKTAGTIAENRPWEGLDYCELEGCEEVAVVEISLEYNGDLYKDLLLCRGHAESIIQKIESDDQLDYYHTPIKSAGGLKTDLIRRELLRDEASIRVPDETDPIDVIDPNKTKKKILQASSCGGQYLIELCESENHAKRESSKDEAMPNCDVLSITEYIDSEHWQSVNVKLSSLVRLDVSQDYKDT